MAMEQGLFNKGNGAEGNGASPPADKKAAERQIADIRARLHAAAGQIVLAMSAVPRYRHQSLADLQSLVIDPLMRDRIAIASVAPAKGDIEGDEPQAGAQMAGVAIWASVSDEVDAKIREQIKAGVFPIRLKPEDWASGDKAWLLDVIAPSQKLASAVLANFSQVVKQGDVRIHPIVGRMVDPELLKRLVASAPVAKEAKTE